MFSQRKQVEEKKENNPQKPKQSTNKARFSSSLPGREVHSEDSYKLIVLFK